MQVNKDAWKSNWAIQEEREEYDTNLSSTNKSFNNSVLFPSIIVSKGKIILLSMQHSL